MLALQEDGKAGDLCMVWSGINVDEQSELDDDDDGCGVRFGSKSNDDEGAAKHRKSFVDSNPWSLARIEAYDLTTLDDDVETALAKDFKICILSDSKPEVAPTGIVENWSMWTCIFTTPAD